MSFLRGLIAVVMGVVALRAAAYGEDEVDHMLGTTSSLEGWVLVLAAILMLLGGVWLMARGRRAPELLVWASGATTVLAFYLSATLDPALYDTRFGNRVGIHLVVLQSAGALVLCAGALELRVRMRNQASSDPGPNSESSAEPSVQL